jgi:hypothetical protein
MTKGAAFGLAVFTALGAGMAACALFIGIDEIVYRAIDAGNEAEGGIEDARIGGDGSSSGPQHDASFADAGGGSDSSPDGGADGSQGDAAVSCPVQLDGAALDGSGIEAGGTAFGAPCACSAQCTSGCCCDIVGTPVSCDYITYCTVENPGTCL